MLYGKTISNKKRAKYSNTQTVYLYGGTEIDKDLENECKNCEIIGKKSIKASEETGMDQDNFVHVIESYMKKTKFPVVVKIHDSNSYFIRKELEAYDKLKNFENSVHKICDFSCMDDKMRWEHMVDSPITFCNNKKDSLHFIVLEYIEDGKLSDFFSKMPNKNIICSFYLQTILSIIIMAYTYRISHGDLNSGNLLVGKTDKSRIHYRFQDKEYRIPTYGITPKFIDYGRSSIYHKVPSSMDVLDDIYTCLYVISLYVKQPDLKQKLLSYIQSSSEDPKKGLHQLIMEIKDVFS